MRPSLTFAVASTKPLLRSRLPAPNLALAPCSQLLPFKVPKVVLTLPAHCLSLLSRSLALLLHILVCLDGADF